MFRIVVISLFVANVFLVGLQVGKPPRKTEVVSKSVVAAGDTDIPTIYLFSEIMQDQDLMTGNRQCFTLGPFHDIEDMYAVRSRLQEISLSTNNRQTQAVVEKGYWVFLRPYRSLLEANEELFTLQALGLTDIAVIYEGENKNSISLGYFLRQENALKRKQALEAKGYEPLVRVQRQTEPRYWLDYEQNPGSDLITLDMQSRPNDFLQRSLPCPEQPQFEAIAAESGQQEPESQEPEPQEPGLLEAERLKSQSVELAENTTESELPKSAPLETELLQSAPLESEPPKSEPSESESSESESLESESSESESSESEISESELPKSALLDAVPLQSAPLETELLESELSESESEISESEFQKSEPLDTVLLQSAPLETELPESELPESELPDSGLLKFGPPVLEPLESELPAVSEAPVQTNSLEERDGPEREDE